MKFIALTAAALLLGLGAVHAAPPKLPIDQALQLALDHLRSRGLAGEHYIASLTLEDSALLNGEKYWLARWAPAIRVDRKIESGLQIGMDGSLARITSGGPASVRPLGPRNNR